MADYPIWLGVNAPDYKQDKSFGAKERTDISIRVGTSHKNSYGFAELSVNRIEHEDDVRFQLILDGTVIKTITFNKEVTRVEHIRRLNFLG